MEEWAKSIQEKEETETPEEDTQTADDAASGTVSDGADASAGTDTADTTKPKKQKVRTTTEVYVREGPSTDAAAYKLVAKGKRFIKLGEEGDWTQVKYGDKTAYVKSEFLEDITE